MERKGHICATCSLSRPASTGLGARGRLLLLLRLLRLLLRLQRRDGAALAPPPNTAASAAAAHPASAAATRRRCPPAAATTPLLSTAATRRRAPVPRARRRRRRCPCPGTATATAACSSCCWCWCWARSAPRPCRPWSWSWETRNARQVRGSCRVPARSLWPVPASKYVRLQCCLRVLLLVAARLGGVKTDTPLALRRDRQPSSLTRGKRAGLAVAAQLSSLPFSVAGTERVGQSDDTGR